jgi:hypothetical protein
MGWGEGGRVTKCHMVEGTKNRPPKSHILFDGPFGETLVLLIKLIPDQGKLGFRNHGSSRRCRHRPLRLPLWPLHRNA